MKVRMKCNVKHNGVFYVGGRDYEIASAEAKEIEQFAEIIDEKDAPKAEAVATYEASTPDVGETDETKGDEISVEAKSVKAPAKKAAAKKKPAKRTTKK